MIRSNSMPIMIADHRTVPINCLSKPIRNQRASSHTTRHDTQRAQWIGLDCVMACATTDRHAHTSNPSNTVPPAGGSNLALVPGKSAEKMDPKSLVTFCHVV